MSYFDLKEQLAALLEPVLQEQGFELADLEWRPEASGWVLRVFLDSVGSSVTLKDCEAMSEHIGRCIDQADIIHHSYHLEVSSPGLYRVLKKEKDFCRFIGQRVRVELKKPITESGQKVFTATIGEVETPYIAFVQGKERFKVSFQDIAKANLDPIIEI